MSLFTYWIVCKGRYSGRPYAGPLCAPAGVIPGRVYTRGDYASYDAEADAKRLDALSVACFYVYVWHDEAGELLPGTSLVRGRPAPNPPRVSVGGHPARGYSRQRPTPGTPLTRYCTGVLLPDASVRRLEAEIKAVQRREWRP